MSNLHIIQKTISHVMSLFLLLKVNLTCQVAIHIHVSLEPRECDNFKAKYFVVRSTSRDTVTPWVDQVTRSMSKVNLTYVHNCFLILNNKCFDFTNSISNVLSCRILITQLFDQNFYYFEWPVKTFYYNILLLLLTVSNWWIKDSRETLQGTFDGEKGPISVFRSQSTVTEYHCQKK